jgi:hypothetical protein
MDLDVEALEELMQVSLHLSLYYVLRKKKNNRKKRHPRMALEVTLSQRDTIQNLVQTRD